MNDLIADLLARIQNAIMRRKDNVTVINTKMNRGILDVLKKEQMIEDYAVSENGREIDVALLYKEGEPAITSLKRISKSGQRIYITSKNIKPIMNGRGIAIISTSKGIMNGAVAKSSGLGGELICEVW